MPLETMGVHRLNEPQMAEVQVFAGAGSYSRKADTLEAKISLARRAHQVTLPVVTLAETINSDWCV